MCENVLAGTGLVIVSGLSYIADLQARFGHCCHEEKSPLADLPSMGIDVTLLSLELLSNGRH